MLHAVLIKGIFQDSVTLMVVSRDLSSLPKVNRVSVMMGTPANKNVFRETSLWHTAFEVATPNDLCIVVDSDDVDTTIAGAMAEQVRNRLAEMARSNRKAGYPLARTWRRARQLLPDANLALISVAGHYVIEPARQALEDGCNVMIFSDNVSLGHELELKLSAREKGLLVMGPDCGTAIINKAPLAFANRVPSGPIAVVGASGTGTQEVTCQIARLGSGITHALGLGGRDLSERIGGISALTALDYVAQDSASRVIAFVSKPPSPIVKERILKAMKNIGKPVVALFLGERVIRRNMGNIHFTQTLDETAALAVELASIDAHVSSLPSVANTSVCGLYCGGTLAAEAAFLLAENQGIELDAAHPDGFMLHNGGHRIIDLGDDAYTRGRPHPMIDPTLRNEMIRALADDQSVGVLLLDVVLGYGGHLDPAGEIVTAVAALRADRGDQTPIIVIANLTGTTDDPQDRGVQAKKLEMAGILIAESVRSAILIAGRAISAQPAFAGQAPALLREAPAIVNIGLRSFADDLMANEVKVVHEQWEPAAGGNEHMQRLLAQLN